MCHPAAEAPEEHKVVCPKCEGEGYDVVHAGSYFDVAYGNYLPKEESVLCEKCEGDGYVWTDKITEDTILWKDEWEVNLPKALWPPDDRDPEDYK